MGHKRSAERVEFLSDLLDTAVSQASYWAEEIETTGNGYSIVDTEDNMHFVTIDTIAHGIQVLTTGENAGHSFSLCGMDYWKQFLLANRTNGKDGDYDSDIADNVLQAGIYEEIVYG